jgi:hypothetical protein
MKRLTLATVVALSMSTAAFAQSTTTPPNPNNCSPAFPNCSSSINGNNKTPGNQPGTSRNEMRQEERIPQTATDPNLPMNRYDCQTGAANCPPNSPAGTSR